MPVVQALTNKPPASSTPGCPIQSMNPATSVSQRVLRCIALTLVWLLPTIHAQTAGTGTIQGRVFNPVSKEYVRNAEVRLEGTNQITYTENDGTFQFNNVPAGSATVTVNFTGYNPAKENFTVAAGQTAVREINLTSTEATAGTKDGVVQLQAFTVSSEREGNAKAIMEQRRAMNITTSVSSDIFGDVTDGNVGEFLKYLPSISITSSQSRVGRASAAWTDSMSACRSTACAPRTRMPIVVVARPPARRASKGFRSRASTRSRSTGRRARRTTPTRRPAS